MPQSPLQQIRILKMEPWTIPVDSHPIGRPFLSYLALREFYSPDVVVSGHLPRHSRRLRIPATLSPQERQNISENNINITLAALTTQLVANPLPPPIPNISPLLISSPPVSLPSTLMVRQARPKLSCSPDFSGECHNGHIFLNFCFLYIYLVPEQFHDKEKSKPGEILSNNSSFTSSLLTQKQTQSTCWKAPPTTKEVGR